MSKMFLQVSKNVRDLFLIRSSSTFRYDFASWCPSGHWKNLQISPHSCSHFIVPQNIELRQNFIMTVPESLTTPFINQHPLNLTPIFWYYSSIHLEAVRETREVFSQGICAHHFWSSITLFFLCYTTTEWSVVPVTLWSVYVLFFPTTMSLI